MSFTADTKKELTTVLPGKKCCQLAQIAGFLRYAGSIKLMEGGPGIKLVTESPAVARLFLTLCRDYFGAKAALSLESPGPLSKGHSYELLITPAMNAEGILRETGMLAVREGKNFLTDGIAPELVRRRCCRKAMLRGIFLAAGSISDPARGYHLEIVCATQQRAEDLRRLINSFGLHAKLLERRGRYVVYIKDGDQIGDFLNIMGASSQFFRFQDVRITREMRNRANRLNNCENANTEKAVDASQRQLAQIALIEKVAGLDSLPEKLQQTAILRKENPELSLSELAELFEPPLKKSGLNHRFEKIASIAEDLQKNANLSEGPKK